MYRVTQDPEIGALGKSVFPTYSLENGNWWTILPLIFYVKSILVHWKFELTIHFLAVKIWQFYFAKVGNTEELLMKLETSYRRIRPPTVAENSICVDRKKLSIFWPCEIQWKIDVKTDWNFGLFQGQMGTKLLKKWKNSW